MFFLSALKMGICQRQMANALTVFQTWFTQHAHLSWVMTVHCKCQQNNAVSLDISQAPGNCSSTRHLISPGYSTATFVRTWPPAQKRVKEVLFSAYFLSDKIIPHLNFDIVFIIFFVFLLSSQAYLKWSPISYSQPSELNLWKGASYNVVSKMIKGECVLWQ